MSSLPSIPASFYRSRKRFVQPLLGTVFATASAIYLTWPSVLVDPLASIAGGVMALSLLLQLVRFIPSYGSLQLTEEGFSYRGAILRKRYGWNQVSGFGVGELENGEEYVGFNRAGDSTKPKRKPRRALRIYDARLPDTYAHEPVDLARMLSLCHAHFAPEEHSRVPVTSPR